MIYRGCIYNILRVNDIGYEAPYLGSVPVVKNFLEKCPDDLPQIPLEIKIDFGID